MKPNEPLWHDSMAYINNNKSEPEKEIFVSKSMVNFDSMAIEIIGSFLNIYEETNDKIITTRQKEFDVEVGTDPSDLGLKIISENLENIVVEQCMQTSMTIMNEGPHCDLTDWLHHTTEWERIAANDTGSYTLFGYTESDTKKFPPVTVNELKNAARKHCGDEWKPVIDQIRDLEGFHSSVGMNKVLVRISGTDKVSGRKVERQIMFIFSMGC
jgi:hypothetical protein